jgi:hypothetical protein
MDALPHPYGAEPTHHRLLFNFPMNRCCPVVSPSSKRRLDSAPLAAAWLIVSPPNHCLPTPIKRAPVSASPHRALRSPPFLTSAPRAPSRRGTPASTSVHRRPTVGAPPPSHANRGRDPLPLLLLPAPSWRDPAHRNIIEPRSGELRPLFLSVVHHGLLIEVRPMVHGSIRLVHRFSFLK